MSDPANRARLVEYYPREFLERPDAQGAIRSITFPLPLIARLRATVRSAYGRAWEGGRVPVLILQGTEDPVRTRSAAGNWPGAGAGSPATRSWRATICCWIRPRPPCP